MLRSWNVARFKSIRSEVSLPLAPLTLFAGANSAGKSTIIQSILLTAQTLQSALHNRAVILNGHIARLGTFSDIASESSEAHDIRIGFQLVVAPDVARDRAYRLAGRRRLLRAPFRRGNETPLDIECSFAFSARGSDEQRELLQLQPELEESAVRVHVRSEGSVTTEVVRFARSQLAPSARARQLNLSDDSTQPGLISSLRWEVAERRGQTQGYAPAKAKDAGLLLNHFLPEAITVAFDAVGEEVQQNLEALTGSERRYGEAWRESTLEMPRAVAEIVRSVARAALEELESTAVEHMPTRQRVEVARLLERLRSESSDELLVELGKMQRTLSVPLRVIIAGKLEAKRDELRTALRAGRGPRWEMRALPLPEAVGYGVDAMQQFFANDVRYLGPLRDEPKAVYPLSAASDTRDVGFRGEHTAAVLDVHRNTEVSYIMSPSAEPAVGRDAETVKKRLTEAVLDWLRYMGVGSDVRTEDKGKLGHELRVASAGSTALHDLTHVGVGVSQVLPILVLSLLAEKGSTLIFEQPELHLHPRVQSRLADFFVAMTQLGKQCIVETHSEYLINRLRYRAAVAEGKEIAESVVMYFVEKRQGESVYRQVRINEFGVIEDWPEGFFDENEELAAEVLRAGMQKRRAAQRGKHA